MTKIGPIFFLREMMWNPGRTGEHLDTPYYKLTYDCYITYTDCTKAALRTDGANATLRNYRFNATLRTDRTKHTLRTDRRKATSYADRTKVTLRWLNYKRPYDGFTLNSILFRHKL